MTRLWVNGEKIIVEADETIPQRLMWRERTHVVQEIANRWRVDVGWWRLRLWRDYFKLTTDTGLLLIVYRDLASGDWYVQRLYD